MRVYGGNRFCPASSILVTVKSWLLHQEKAAVLRGTQEPLATCRAVKER